ncbi:MAG: hypothetical protein Q7R56_00070 [Nanoarchaeota archaeon]|nr:hypothetical protein [Nanoarchaeota archaeon]
MITSEKGKDRLYRFFMRDGLEDNSVFDRELALVMQKEISGGSKPGLLVDTPMMRYVGLGSAYLQLSSGESYSNNGINIEVLDMFNPGNPRQEVSVKIREINRLLLGVDPWQLSEKVNGLVAYMFSPSFDVRAHQKAVQAYQSRLDNLLRGVAQQINDVRLRPAPGTSSRGRDGKVVD